MRYAEGNSLYFHRAKDNGIGGSLPDNYIKIPDSNFVLCRDKSGKPTAVYGSDQWDFNPYRLSAVSINVIRFFQGWKHSDSKLIQKYVNQIKFILYQIIYLSGSGRIGRASASTVVQYYSCLRTISAYGIEWNQNDLTKDIGLFDILSSSVLLSKVIGSKENNTNFKKVLSSILNHLSVIDYADLGFIPCNKKELDLSRQADNQHPVIPHRIYLGFINFLDEKIDLVLPLIDNIESMVIEMKDRSYGAALATQKKRRPRLDLLRPDMNEVLNKFKLTTLFTGVFSLSAERASVVGFLTRIQYICKLSIHLYTGMREQEVLRLANDCIQSKCLTSTVCKSNEEIVDPSRVVSIISSTTKFSGYKQEAAWLAPEQVIKSVKILQSISRAISYLHDVEFKSNTPLFLSPSIVRSDKSKYQVTTFVNKGRKGVFDKIADGRFIIAKHDLEELKLTDLDRDFDSEDLFNIGEYWPVSGHQFRRSLAFYGRNSHFLSLPTITSQYKHTCRQMSQYYARNNSNFLPMFGTYDEKAKIYIMNGSHVAHEFQTAVSREVVDQFFRDLLDDDRLVIGGSGSYAQKIKQEIVGGVISIAESKEKTVKMANDGQFNYTETHLGGCSKNGNCNEYLMGEIIPCLVCPEAVIKETNLNNTISIISADIDRYADGSPEQKMAELDLTELESYRTKKFSKLTDSLGEDTNG